MQLDLIHSLQFLMWHPWQQYFSSTIKYLTKRKRMLRKNSFYPQPLFFDFITKERFTSPLLNSSVFYTFTSLKNQSVEIPLISDHFLNSETILQSTEHHPSFKIETTSSTTTSNIISSIKTR